jgi:hypothetical protein
MDFNEFQEKAVNGVLANCFVTYKLGFGLANTGVVMDTITVTGTREELTDFESALSDEATDGLDMELEPYLSEKYDTDIAILEYEVKHIIVRADNEDLSSQYIAFTPDGRTLLLNISAVENFESLLESLSHI